MRDPGFDLISAIAQPGFTPAVRDADALVQLLGGEDDAVVRHATRGLVALRAAGREAIARQLLGGGVAEGPATRMIAALGALARTGDAAATRLLLPLVTAPAERWRRAAVVALGKLGGDAARGHLPDAAVDEARAVILARWEAAALSPAERRALTEALGKLGGGAAVDKLAALDPGDDAELARRRDRALVMSRRDQWRLEARPSGGEPGAASGVSHVLASASGGELETAAAELMIEVRGGDSSGWDGPTDPDGSAMPPLGERDEASEGQGGARGAGAEGEDEGEGEGEGEGDAADERGGGEDEDDATDELDRVGGRGAAVRSDVLAGRDSSMTSMVNASDVDPEAPVPELPMLWECRGGLGPLLAEELRGLGYQLVEQRPDYAITRFAGPLGAVRAVRLWTQLGLMVPLGEGELAAAITEAICRPAVRDLLPALTRGAVRWRLELASGGPRRAMVWQVVRDVAQRAPELINEPADTTWTLVVDERRRALLLRPRRLADRRFAWRQIDLPSASHPTVAAAVARLGQPRRGERVWDPFTGSGSELIECALAVSPSGAPLELYGTDLDGDALDAAARNAGAAGVPIALARADARHHQPASGPGSIDLIASNPPLGGRLRGDAGQLLCDAVGGFARALARGGRLVWITPAPRRTSPAAEAAGLVLERAFDVDLGGLRARLERWRKPR
jgi:hypothetical protein